MKCLLLVLALSISVTSLRATDPLKPELSGIGFLVGKWDNGKGEVSENGGTAQGVSVITPRANGGVLLRCDHTDLFDAKGKPAGSFDSLMTIYPEAGTIQADYFDGDHIIRYVSAVITAGKSVTFSSAAQPGAPLFKLTYSLEGKTLSVLFGMVPPGQTEFHQIAKGSLQRQ